MLIGDRNQQLPAHESKRRWTQTTSLFTFIYIQGCELATSDAPIQQTAQ